MSAGVVQGNAPRFRVTFTNSAGVRTDPATVTFLVEDPTHAVTAYVFETDPEVTRESTGVYYIDVLLDAGETWYWRWEGGGTQMAAAQDDIYVIPARPVVVAP